MPRPRAVESLLLSLAVALLAAVPELDEESAPADSPADSSPAALAVSLSTGAGFSGSSPPFGVSSIQRTTLPSE